MLKRRIESYQVKKIQYLIDIKREKAKQADTMSKLAIGRNQVAEALKASLAGKVFIVKGTTGLDDIKQAARDAKVPFVAVNRRKLEDLAAGERHQGVVATLSSVPYTDVAAILAAARSKGEPPLIALLDEIQDPHNLGAILRSAEAAGVHGVTITKHRSAGVTEAAFRASAGAAAHIPVAKVTNLRNTIDSLKKEKVWIVGADQDATETYNEADLTGPLGIVIGGEGKGMRRLIKENCDFTVKIPMSGKVNSLNASVAAALMFFEARRQRTSN